MRRARDGAEELHAAYRDAGLTFDDFDGSRFTRLKRSSSCAAKEARPRPEVARVIFTELELPGAYVVDVETDEDERGHFARIFDDAEFGALDLQTYWPQISVAFNEELGKGGLHYQEQPHAEAKLVRCVRGSCTT